MKYKGLQKPKTIAFSGKMWLNGAARNEGGGTVKMGNTTRSIISIVVSVIIIVVVGAFLTTISFQTIGYFHSLWENELTNSHSMHSSVYLDKSQRYFQKRNIFRYYGILVFSLAVVKLQ